MLKRLTGWFILLPLSLLLVLFAMSNRHTVAVHVDPLSQTDPLFGPFEVPLYLLVYAVLLLGVVLGGVASWFSQGRVRRDRRVLKRETTDLKQRMSAQHQTRATPSTQSLPLVDLKDVN